MFSVTASNAQTYQWQQSTDNGSSWANIESATSASYTISSTATDMSNYQYRCVVKSASGVGVISNAATLTVTEKTEPTTYTISTAEQLYEFATKVNAGNNTACAVLTADITLLIDTNWTPIGNDSNQYKGTFDGDGHTITGLSVDIQSDNTIYAGLFGFLGEGGTIKNLSLADSKITCSGNRVYAGGVCGANAGGTIQNCYNTGDVSGEGTQYVFVGGVCGTNENSATIINCYNTRDVSGTSSYGYVYAGGVCGANAGGTIQNCYNTGDVSGEGTQYVFVGGVCGWNTGTIQNCYWLAGTADCGIGNPPGDTNAQSKTADEFASGEAAWLLNEPQTEKPWGQGSNNMPVLEGNLPDGVTSKTPVRITIVMQDNSEQYRYTTEGSTVAEYPTGYAFFLEDGNTQTWINQGTQTYDSDTTIYAETMTLEKIPAKAPTCTEKGNSEYWYSAAFDKYFKDENGVNEITAESTVIPAKGHGESEVKGAKEATCTEEGYTGDKVCKVCGEILEKGTVIEKFGHVWGEPEWNWSEDGTSCTVTFTCKNNPEHKETPEADVTSEVKTPATCTETGVTTYTATVEFNGNTYTDTKEVADIPATGHSYDNGKCTVCGAIASDFKAVIIEGANGSWQKGTKDGLSFTSNAAFAHFLKVQVDGKDLDVSNYTVKEGSTIVTLKAEYLETLSVGKHTLAIVSETGTATTEFTVKAAAVTDDTQSPQTGDDSNIALWIAVLLAAGAALTGTAVYSRKRKCSR